MKLLQRLVILTILPSLLLLSACGGTAAPTATQISVDEAVRQTVAALPTETSTPTPTATPLPTATPTQVIVRYGPDNFPANVNPLTGLEVSDPAILDRRPMMIKVSNFPREGRPHAGLSAADIVFDYYTGEGGNRFLALFYGTDSEQIGPIRSGRLVDRYLVTMYQGVLGAVYAFPSTWETILNYLGWSRVISEGTNTCPAMCRQEDVMPEISVFANSAEMTKYYAARPNASNTRQNLNGMAFYTLPPAGGVEAIEMTHQFGKNNYAGWKYNPETRKFLRTIESIKENGDLEMVPLTDRNNGEQLEFSNIILVYAEIETLHHDDTLHEIHILNAGGRAVVFRDGMKYELTYKSGWDTPIQFLNQDGTPFELQPGNTWMHFTGFNSELTEESPGVWFSRNWKP
ncbi:MAG TPA: DUF3048 domain-containing protein [Anaerolineaceae bacterium]|nr:DUF3048 domain-containing protein [Anaerolineaceae bacterium]